MGKFRGVLVVAALATALSGAVVPTATAQAAACGVTAPDRDTRAYGQYFLQNVNLRNGPAWECDIDDTATTANSVDYHCTTGGFTYLRTASTKYGWVHNSYLVGGGTNVQC
jgi:hypothetical protein